MPSVLVVGSGLAGLVAARELARHGFQVTILERGERDGGKAGAHLENGRWREHGYHIFPAWYRNVRRILDELGITLIDFDRWHYIKPGQMQSPITHRVPSTPAAFLDTLRGGLLPWYQTVLYFYFVLDMMAEPLSNKAILDRVSRLGLLRSRWYATDKIASLEEENILKASAIPVYELSAMTAKIISANWVRSPSPFLSILPGDLHNAFIAPLVANVLASGVTRRLEHEVTSIDAAGGRIAQVTCRDATGAHTHAADLFIVTTPLEVTRKLIGAQVQALEPDLGNIEHLEAAPMAALHLSLNRKVPGVPREHAFLHRGRYGLSFIDLSQHWPGLPGTELSFISSNFVPLRDLPEQDQYDALFGEISQYLGIVAADVREWALHPNVEDPLFINTIGAWHHRPRVRARRIPNLYFAGDWVRNKVDLACMEGAVSSALAAANAAGEDFGAPQIKPPLSARTYDPRLIKLAKWALAPAMVPVWLRAKLDDLR